MAKKTRDMTLGEDIIEGLTGVRDALQEDPDIAERFTVRTVELDLEPPEYDADEIRKLRQALQASQAVFAQVIGVKASTVRSWEQGRREPQPIARRLFEEIEQHIDEWKQRLRDALVEAS